MLLHSAEEELMRKFVQVLVPTLQPVEEGIPRLNSIASPSPAPRSPVAPRAAPNSLYLGGLLPWKQSIGGVPFFHISFFISYKHMSPPTSPTLCVHDSNSIAEEDDRPKKVSGCKKRERGFILIIMCASRLAHHAHTEDDTFSSKTFTFSWLNTIQYNTFLIAIAGGRFCKVSQQVPSVSAS